MKKLFVIFFLLLGGILAACSPNTPQPIASPALGETPTVTAKIANLAEANIQGTNLVLKAFIYIGDTGKEKLIAETSVNANGDFSLKLPALEVSDLDEVENKLLEGQDCTDVVTTPNSYKVSQGPIFRLFSNGQPILGGNNEILQRKTNRLGGENNIQYLFVDRDVVAKANCGSGNDLTGANLDYKKGWNTVLIGISETEKRFGSFSIVPDVDYKWLADVCSFGCP